LTEISVVARIVRPARPPGHDGAVALERQVVFAPGGDGLETGARLDQRDVVHPPRRDHAGLPGSRLRLAGQQRGTNDCQ